MIFKEFEEKHPDLDWITNGYLEKDEDGFYDLKIMLKSLDALKELEKKPILRLEYCADKEKYAFRIYDKKRE
jgi:hypothetical protein